MSRRYNRYLLEACLRLPFSHASWKTYSKQTTKVFDSSPWKRTSTSLESLRRNHSEAVVPMSACLSSALSAKCLETISKVTFEPCANFCPPQCLNTPLPAQRPKYVADLLSSWKLAAQMKGRSFGAAEHDDNDGRWDGH